MYETFVRESYDECLGLIILLPGRGQPARDMLSRYHHFSNLNQFIMVAIEPIDEWYPVPNGAQNQKEAVCGLKLSAPQIDDFIAELEREFGVDRSKITLSGFSAGAVMAIQIAANSDKPFNSVISHNGAILSPEDLPNSIHPTKYLVIHNKNDDCFSWEERYLPMKNTLIERGYDLESFENEIGGHYITQEDVEKVGFWLLENYGLSMQEKQTGFFSYEEHPE